MRSNFWKSVVPFCALLLLFLNGCSERLGKKLWSLTRSAPLSQAQLVSQLPGEYLFYKSPVKIVFAKDMVSKSQVGREDQRGLLVFKPAVTGKIVWTSPTLLEFQPVKAWEKYRTYQGQLNLNKLFTGSRAKLLGSLSFTFETLANEVLALEGSFQPASSGAKYVYQFQGKVVFSEEVLLADLKKSLLLEEAGRQILLIVSGPEPGKAFELKSAAIPKEERVKKIRLLLKKQLLDIPNELEREWLLEKQAEFKVDKIESRIQGEKRGLVVLFNDLLNPKQNPDGFVTTEPQVTVALKVMANKLQVWGKFELGQSYQVKVNPGIKNIWDDGLKTEYCSKFYLEDLKPEIRFSRPGVFLPTANQNKITFQTLNVKKIKLQVMKVFASNLGPFLQTGRLEMNQDAWRFSAGEFQRVGVMVKEQELVIGTKKNQWLTQELDLKQIFNQEERGLFIIQLSFTRDDILYRTEENQVPRDEYEWGYLQKHGTVILPVILSDIGLTVKHGYRSFVVYTNDLRDTHPLSGIKVRLMTYQNQLAAESITNLDGRAEFKEIAQEIFYVEALSETQRSVVKLADMAWNLSGYDIDGVESTAGKVSAFLYTDRGVYRPGDSIHFSIIARNQNGTFPDNHPVTVKFYNPRGQLINEQTLRQAKDGFYALTLQTQANDPTGDWVAEALVGDEKIRKNLQIEAVVPNRLKVEIQPAKAEIESQDKQLNFQLSAAYLYGSPGAGLNTEINGVLESVDQAFPGYSQFCFTHEAIKYQPYGTNLYSGELNEAGKLTSTWNLPELGAVPSGLRAIVQAKVFEKGGRYTASRQVIPVNPYPAYVGMERVPLDYGYFMIPENYKTRVILLHPGGNPVSGHTLNYRLYKNQNWWWWEYHEQEERKLKFKTDSATEQIASGTIISRKTPVPLNIKLEESGTYLLEVQDGKEGHTAGYFIEAAGWGSAPQTQREAGSVILKADKEKYFPGDTALVSFPVPQAGRILCGIEQGSEILTSWWEVLEKGKKEWTLAVPITDTMVPNVYLSVSIIQPHAQTKNDLSLRMYGVVALKVEKLETRRELQIIMPEELKPEKEFYVEVRSRDHKPYQATLAVVDVGLLDLTNFPTPDPWAFFFRKLRLGVLTSDLYGQVIGANKDDIYKLFSIGGGESIAGRYNPIEAKRFQPVALFQGPVASDSQGKLKVRFTMPNAVGAVKVMVVAAEKQSYGKSEKVVPVKQALMVQPTLPRVLGPNETLTLPVDVITMKDDLGPISIQLKVEGPVAIVGEGQKSLEIKKAGNQLILFQIKTLAAVGKAKLRVEAQAKPYHSYSETEIAVRPASPRLSTTSEQTVAKGQTIRLKIPGNGLPGSNEATLSIRRLPRLNFDQRLGWLIHYPYGCIEQTTSSVFPQLYLKAFLDKSPGSAGKIDQNINAGIARLKQFVMPSGGFSYWPGGNYQSPWGTNYAGHFLLEAKKCGYFVPEDMLGNWIRFEQSQALKAEDNRMERVYRVYLLALAGNPANGAMNLLKENDLKNLSNPERWLLAAAYKLAGSESVAREILRKATLEVREYVETGGSFGCQVRDQAIILEALVLFNRMTEAQKMFEIIGDALSTQEWYSTQTIAYGLLAMGKYLQKINADYTAKKPRLQGTIQLPDGKQVSFDTQELIVRQPITQGFGQEAEVYLGPATTVPFVYAAMDWSGIPLEAQKVDQEHNLSLGVKWLDENGDELDPGALRQGVSFWGKITVHRLENQANRIENVALVQVLPSGWEIENLRLRGENLPSWAKESELTKEDYLDLRDDRLLWFFSMSYQPAYTFIFKVNAITAGSFQLPPTQVEAMYDQRYKATRSGRRVTVTSAFKP